METSLHRELKSLCGDADTQEVRVGEYRIDCLRGDELVEIQHAGLAALRTKTAALVKRHRLCIVKPVIASRRLIKLKRREGEIVSSRLSPKRGRLLDAFAELVHFTQVYPHPRLRLEILLVDVEELRVPGHGRRRRWRRNDFEVVDRRLVGVRERVELATAADLHRLLPDDLPETFDTQQLADAADVPRWLAQQIAYCLHRCGAAELIGKARNSRLYRLAA
ncbi:MAG: hypothetical protein K1X74_05385 [Pirellulales bacterium]|nr:hypothetical protein [Pirellulales bacterium]